MKPEQPTSIVSTLAGICVSILLAAMALYAAVQILAAIFVPLCIVLAIVGSGVGAWLFIRRMRGF